MSNVMEIIVRAVDQASNVLNNIGKQGEQATKNLEKSFKNAGKAMTNAGKTLSTHVTAPLAGLATVSVTTVAKFDDSMSQVAAISGATGNDLERLRDLAKDLGATTRYSASEAADAMTYLALAGYDTNQILEATPGMLNLAAAAGMDLATTADIVTDTMSGFQMSADRAGEAADIFAAASSKSNTNVEQLGEAMKYASSTANAAGMDLAQTAAILGIFADSGVKGSMAGTTFNAILRDMKSKAKDGAIAVGDMSIAIYNADGTMRDLGSIMADVEQATKGMTTAQRDAALSAIFGSEAMRGVNILLAAGSERYKELEEAMYNSTGASQKMAETMEDNVAGAFREFKSQVEGILIQIGEQLAPILRDTIIPLLSGFGEKISNLIEWFAGLDEGTKRTIITMLGLAAAVGPVLMVGGKMASGIGSIIGLFAKFKAASTAATAATSAMSSGIGVAGLAAKAGALLLNPWTIGIAAATAGGIALAEHLKQDSIPAVNLFSEEVSESTQEAVGSFLELEEQATLSLNQLAWSGEEVTGEMAESIIGNFEGMKEQVVTKLEEQKTEALTSLSEMVENSINMTEEEKEEMIRITTESYDEQIKKTEEGNARIKEILETAKNENRAITEEEKNEINKIKEEMKNDGIRILSESEKEHLAIMERLKQESGKISALQAAGIVKNSKEQKEKTIAEAEKEYEERLKYAAELRASGSKEAEEMADKIVEEATRQKDEAIKNAEEMHNKVVKEAKEQAKEHVKEVDWETGEVKTKWQVMKDDIQTKAKGIKEDVINKWEEIKKSTAEKWEGMKNTTERIWNSMVTIVKAPVNAIIKIINGLIGALNRVRIKIPKVPDWIPGIGGKGGGTIGFNIPKIPYLARGGFIKGGNPTPAVIGEGRYDEAVIPLSDSVLSKLAEMITGKMNLAGAGAGGGDIIIQNMYVRNDTDIELIARRLWQLQKSRSRGRGR